MKKKPIIPDSVTAGLSTVGIRCPSHAVARLLIQKAGVPIAAPSANLSGRPSTTEASHVIDDLNGKVDVILCGGNSVYGLESTVLDITRKPAVILRPGFITLEDLSFINPDTIQADTSMKDGIESPNEAPSLYREPRCCYEGPVKVSNTWTVFARKRKGKGVRFDCEEWTHYFKGKSV